MRVCGIESTDTLVPPDRPLRVVIVGGGASGVLVAARTLDASIARSVQVTIVDPSDVLAAGVAYSTVDPEHLLNVRASGMSADPSSPDDLVEWITATGEGGRDTFVPRRDYRRYLEQHLRHAAQQAPDGTLELCRDRAIGIRMGDTTTRVALASGAHLDADHVVLALGNSAPGVPESLRGLEGRPGWIPDPWAPGVLEPYVGAPNVLLVGTGLTMVDIAITLGRDGDRPGEASSEGCATAPRLMALSRNGLVPLRHLEFQPPRPIDIVDLDRDSVDVLALDRRIRARILDHEGRQYPDENWREVIDAVRPFANALWRRYDSEQRRTFLTQLLRQWDVHRHRMSPVTAERFDALQASGRLRIHTGQVLVASPDPAGGMMVELDLDGERTELQVDAVVNCTGPGRSWSPPGNPVVMDLIDQGLAVPDEHGLGLRTTPEGLLVDVGGRPVPQVLVIGPPRRGTLFETTAVPELRSQALHLADHMVIGVPFA